MSVVTVRNLPEETHRALKLRAAQHGQYLEKGERRMYVIVKGNGKEIDRVKVKFIGPNY